MKRLEPAVPPIWERSGRQGLFRNRAQALETPRLGREREERERKTHLPRYARACARVQIVLKA